MDFFEHQEAARRRTGRLVVLFALAVIAIIVMVYFAVSVILTALVLRSEETPGFDPQMLWRPELLLGVGAGTIVLVLAGSLYKMAQLRSGGSAVAQALGARRLDPGDSDVNHRKVLNVVEEMAIASGTPVPPVYLLEEEKGINAFAAGYSPDDAVIGVTRGCVEKLSRDELQGVMGHEFSHILNGDMRLNIRLIGWTSGILLIGVTGYYVMRSLRYASVSGRSSSSRGKKGGGGAIILAILLIGLALIVIGYVGVFFGKLIQAAVSRQREFLADAASVQFTRNPDGIAGALQRIGGDARGSKLEGAKTREVRHMLFSQGFSSWLSGLFATHPPLAERIRRINPHWQGSFAAPEPSAAEPTAAAPAAAAGMSAFSGAGSTSGGGGDAARSGVQQIGQPTDAHLTYAAQLIADLPAGIRQLAREPFGARAVVWALLLDEDLDLRRMQLQRLAEHVEPAAFAHTQAIAPAMQQLNPAARLPLLDLAIPALREMSPGQHEAFERAVTMLIRADEKIEVFEWSLRHILLRHLRPQFDGSGGSRRQRVRHVSLKPVEQQASLLLSTLAHVGARDAQQAAHAFAEGAGHLPTSQAVTFLPRERVRGLSALDEALDELATVAPPLKRAVISACAACISADRTVTVREAELLRAVSDALDCPMPPLLPGQPLV